ncbi:MAG: hypothetical protein J7484_08065 [Microbacterium sp.]|nr:hypothetical protein [Microbacterium sp.]
MTRRTAWIVAAAVAAALLVVTAIWLLQGRGSPDAPSSPTATATATPTGSVEERAQEALDRRLTACAAHAGAAPPEHCGIRIPWGTEFAVVSGIRFRIETLPVLAVDGSSFTAAGGSLVATVTGTGQDGAPRTETYRTDDWTVRGDLLVDGSAIDVSIW